jgi:hypothetical protein
MRNGKDITSAESFRMLLLSLDQAIEKILVLALLALRVSALFELTHRSSCDEGILGGEERNELPERVASEDMIEPWNLPDQTVVPLRVVNRLDSAVYIDTSLKEAEFLGKGDFS